MAELRKSRGAMSVENISKAEREALNLEYLPGLTIPNVDEYLENAAARSAAVRERLECHIDVSYGDTPGQTIDVFPAASSGAPVFFFIHGGYWRSLDKHYYSELAEPMVAAGAATMLVNYDLCPAVTITDIVEQVRRAPGVGSRQCGELQWRRQPHPRLRSFCRRSPDRHDDGNRLVRALRASHGPHHGCRPAEWPLRHRTTSTYRSSGRHPPRRGGGRGK